jgi:hypothetical protein
LQIGTSVGNPNDWVQTFYLVKSLAICILPLHFAFYNFTSGNKKSRSIVEAAFSKKI